MKPRALIYARQSLDKTGESAAVSRQLDACRQLVAQRGWEVVAEHVDNDTSATSAKPRPAYNALLADLRAGRATAVVVWAADRLYRRVLDLEDLLDVVRSANVSIVTATSGDIDLSSPGGRMQAGIFANVARHEVEQKGARQAYANEKRAEAGDVRWTRRPYGYRSTSSGPAIDGDEAVEITRAAGAVLGGATLASVVRDLNGRGVSTSTGAAWTVTTLRRVLLNPRHAGIAVYRGAERGRIPGESILDEDTHRQLVATLTDPARRTAAETRTKYLLSGLALCGRCGDRMFASPMGRGDKDWMVYRCLRTHNHRHMERVDEVVVGSVLARLAQPDAAAALAPDRSAEAQLLRDRSLELRSKIDDLATLLGEGVLSIDGVREVGGRLRRELEDVERGRASLSREPEIAALADTQRLAETWAGLSLRGRRAVVSLLMDVTILAAPHRGARFTPDQVRIDWRSA